MSSRGMVGGVVGAMWLAMAAPAWAQAAAASSTATCSADFVSFQEDRQAARLLSARAAALRCARDECPDSIRKVCIGAVDEIGASIPTVVLRAVGPDGCDTTTAEVRIDGVVREGPLDGKAMDLDPGSHAITVRIEGAEPITRTVLVAQGEKNRAVVADASEGATCGRPRGTASGPTAESTAAPEDTRPITVPTIVLASVGVAALGTSAVFGATGLARRGDACDDAGCDPAEIDGIRTSFIVADVLLATGVVSLGVATVLHLTRPTERAEVGLRIDLGPRGPRAAVGGSF